MSRAAGRRFPIFVAFILWFALAGVTFSSCSADSDDDSSQVSPAGDDDTSPPADTESPGDDDASSANTPTIPPSDDDTLNDGDGDGFSWDTDCDDGDPAIYPDAPEVCDGADNDCDEEIDETAGAQPLEGSPTWYRDEDGDGFGLPDADTKVACLQPDGYGAGNTDCNDQDGAIYPGAVELCDDVDQNCNGLTMEPDPQSKRQGELRFALDMVSPNLGLPIDALTCYEDSGDYLENPRFWVFPQAQYGTLSTWADTTSCTSVLSTAFKTAFVDDAEDAQGLYSLAIDVDISQGCQYGGIMYTVGADLSRYSTIKIRYAFDGDGPAVLKFNTASGPEPVEELEPTGGAFVERTFSIEDYTSIDWSRFNYFVVAFEAARGVSQGRFLLDQLLIEASPDAFATNPVTCTEGESYPDFACLEPYTSTTNIGLSLAQLATAFSLGELEKTDALARTSRIVDHLMAQRGWTGAEAAGDPWTRRGWMQTWISPFSGMPNPRDKWISLLDNANLVAGLIVADVAFEGEDSHLEASISTLLTSMPWYLFNDGITQYGGYLREAGCGLADGTWETDDCPVAPTEWRHDLVGNDSFLGSFLSYAYGAMTNDTWTSLGCAMDEYTSPTDGTTYQWYATSDSLVQPSDIPGMSDGGLFLAGAASIFLDTANLPVAEGYPTLAESARQLLLAQQSYAERYNLNYWGWSNCRDVETCDYLVDEAVTLQYVAPYGTLMQTVLLPEEILEQACAFSAADLEAPFTTGTRSYEWGYRDSITQSHHYNEAGYLFLDKAWTWLGLTSFYEDDVVRKLFAAHPRIEAALAELPPLCEANAAGQ